MSPDGTEAVRAYWDTRPCGTADIEGQPEHSREFFQSLDARRYTLEPFIGEYARFTAHRGRRLLEIGCGVGGDLMRFARGGARVTGVDLSPRSLALTRRRFELAGLRAPLCVADAEALPFPDSSFDVVYSWGVLHHAPHTPRAIREVARVLRPEGRACVMLYHRRSLVVLQAWIRFALLRGRPWLSPRRVLATSVESPGTKAYTVREVRALFADAGFAGVTVERVATRWDARLGRRRFLPAWCLKLLPARWGWFLVIQARGAAR